MAFRQRIKIRISRRCNYGRESSAMHDAVIYKGKDTEKHGKNGEEDGDAVGDYEVVAVVWVDILCLVIRYIDEI
jgi:hypothetical protein